MVRRRPASAPLVRLVSGAPGGRDGRRGDAAWRTVTLFNPLVYLINGFRWSFFGHADVAVGISLAMTLLFFAVCLAIVSWMFRTGYRLKS